MGGGFFGGNFFPGKPTVDQYAQTICGILRKRIDSKKITLVLEPGAAVLATAMDYLVSVLNIRDIRGKTVVTVDGSVVHINPFTNPHPTPFTMINPGVEVGTEKAGEQIIGGSTCMELDRIYPRDICHMVTPESRLLFHCCGAYMSTHNSSFIIASPNIYIKENDTFGLLRKKDSAQMLVY
jgi:diaminopimelate decarboxylase